MLPFVAIAPIKHVQFPTAITPPKPNAAIGAAHAEISIVSLIIEFAMAGRGQKLMRLECGTSDIGRPERSEPKTAVPPLPPLSCSPSSFLLWAG